MLHSSSQNDVSWTLGPLRMKPKVWIWTAVLAFLGYSLGGKGAIEHPTKELLGAVAGGALGFSIGWGIQRYDERRKRHSL